MDTNQFIGVSEVIDQQWLGSGYDLNFFDTKKQLIWKKSFILRKSKIGAEDFFPQTQFSYNQKLKKGTILVRDMIFGECA